MSSSTAECWEFSGGKLPEKASFSQTCTRLNRCLKEKGSFGDLSLGMTCKPNFNGGFAASRQPTMMNMFPCEASGINSSAPQDVKPNNMFLANQVFLPPQNLAKYHKEIASTTPNPVLCPAKTAAQEPIQTNTSSLAWGLHQGSVHRRFNRSIFQAFHSLARFVVMFSDYVVLEATEATISKDSFAMIERARACWIWIIALQCFVYCFVGLNSLSLRDDVLTFLDVCKFKTIHKQKFSYELMWLYFT